IWFCVDTLDGHDFVLQRQDRLDPQRSSEPGLRLADPPAAPEVLERVDAEPDPQRLASLAHARDDPLNVEPRTSGGGCREHQQADAATAAFAVDHLHALAETALGEQRMGLARCLT